MIVERTGRSSLRIQAPAKLNLFLEVLGKRPDGFHELLTVMHTVSLYDTLEIARKGTTPTLQVKGRETGPVNDNLALKAARLFNAELGEKQGFEIYLDKKIPVGGGLGGGSSDCAAVLLGCNLLCGQPFNQEALAGLAAQTGSDVPFFLYGGTARCTGRGEKIEPIQGVPALNFVILHPGISMSTRKVYENLNLGLTDCKNDYSLVNALLKSADPAVINACLFNRLEQAAMEADPAFSVAFHDGRKAGFKQLRVTGSGSCFFQAMSSIQTEKGISAETEPQTQGNRDKLFTIEPHWERFLVQSSPPVRF